MSASETNVRVVCRFRPINKREKAEGSGGKEVRLSFPNDTVVEVVSHKGPHLFTLDRVYSQCSQEEIYNNTARDSIDDVLNGYNATIFAYGQTGAGKSFTMFGPDLEESKLKGIIPRACSHIFEHIHSDGEGTEYTIKCSFLEIYKEQVKDLLRPNSGNLRVRESPARGVWVENLSEEFVTSEKEVLDLLMLGEKYRSTASTGMNDTSSRSHSLFVLTLTQRSKDGSSKTSRLNLADLAGSEKVGKTGATGDTLEEAKKINQSLSALGNCINALTKANRGHVPYRDSKLTFILRESLGGNTKTTLIVACSPHPFNIDETIGTLRFAQRAKTIKNTVTVNQKRSVEELEKIVASLLHQMGNLKAYIELLEAEIVKVHGEDFDFKSLKSAAGAKANSNAGKGAKGAAAGAMRSALTGSSSLADAETEVKIEQVREEMQEQVANLEYELEAAREKQQEKGELLAQATSQLDALQKETARQKEELATERSKWEYEKQQMLLQVESEQVSAKSALERQQQLQRELQKVQSKLVSAGEEVAALQTAAQQKDEAASKTREQLSRLAAARSALAEKLEASESAAARMQETVEELRKRETETAQRLRELAEQTAALQAAEKDLKVQLSAEQQQRKLLDESMQQALRKAKSKLEQEKESSVSRVEEELEASEQRVLQLQKQLVSAESGASQKDIEIERLQSTCEAQAQDVAALQAKLAEAESASSAQQSDAVGRVASMEAEIEEYRLQLQRKVKEMHQKDEEHRVALESQLSVFRKKLAERDAEVEKMTEKLSAMRVDLNEQQSKNIIFQKQEDERTKRIAALESELVEKTALIQELKSDIESACQLNIENSLRFEQDLKLIEERHRKAAEKRQAVIVRSIVGSSSASGSTQDKSATPDHGGKESTSSWWSSRKLPTVKELGVTHKSGWLTKQGGWVRTWRKRWFVLKGNGIYYFDSPDAERSKGVIEMGSDCIVQKADEYTNMAHSFGLFHTKGRVFFLCAESDDERDDWIAAITAELQKTIAAEDTAM